MPREKIELSLCFTPEETALLAMANMAGMMVINNDTIKMMIIERARQSVHRFANDTLDQHRAIAAARFERTVLRPVKSDAS